MNIEEQYIRTYNYINDSIKRVKESNNILPNEIGISFLNDEYKKFFSKLLNDMTIMYKNNDITVNDKLIFFNKAIAINNFFEQIVSNDFIIGKNNHILDIKHRSSLQCNDEYVKEQSLKILDIHNNYCIAEINDELNFLHEKFNKNSIENINYAYFLKKFEEKQSLLRAYDSINTAEDKKDFLMHYRNAKEIANKLNIINELSEKNETIPNFVVFYEVSYKDYINLLNKAKNSIENQNIKWTVDNTFTLNDYKKMNAKCFATDLGSVYSISSDGKLLNLCINSVEAENLSYDKIIKSARENNAKQATCIDILKKFFVKCGFDETEIIPFDTIKAIQNGWNLSLEKKDKYVMSVPDIDTVNIVRDKETSEKLLNAKIKFLTEQYENLSFEQKLSKEGNNINKELQNLEKILSSLNKKEQILNKNEIIDF